VADNMPLPGHLGGALMLERVRSQKTVTSFSEKEYMCLREWRDHLSATNDKKETAFLGGKKK